MKIKIIALVITILFIGVIISSATIGYSKYNKIEMPSPEGIFLFKGGKKYLICKVYKPIFPLEIY